MLVFKPFYRKIPERMVHCAWFLGRWFSMEVNNSMILGPRRLFVGSECVDRLVNSTEELFHLHDPTILLR